jgi:hypothetical protein
MKLYTPVCAYLSEILISRIHYISFSTNLCTYVRIWDVVAYRRILPALIFVKKTNILSWDCFLFDANVPFLLLVTKLQTFLLLNAHGGNRTHDAIYLFKVANPHRPVKL